MNNGFRNLVVDIRIHKAREKIHEKKRNSNNHDNKTINLFYCNLIHANYEQDERVSKHMTR